MIYDILLVILVILFIPSGIFLFIELKSLFEMWIRLFLVFIILVFIGKVIPYYILEIVPFILVYLITLGLFGWVFFPVIEKTQMFKDYQLKKEK